MAVMHPVAQANGRGRDCRTILLVKRPVQRSGITALEILSAGAVHAITHVTKIVAVRCARTRLAACAFRLPSALPLIQPYAGRCSNAMDVVPAILKVVGAHLRLVGSS